MQTIILNRYSSNNNATHGTLTLLNKNNVPIYSCVTLELPWRDNARKVSCVAAGLYMAKKENHLIFGCCIRVFGVPNRDGILIHVGNYVRQLQGCIAVGYTSNLLDKDNVFDVSNSRKAIDTLYKLCDAEVQIIVKQA